MAKRTPPSSPKRKRGGQPGNQNAAKHFWYSQALPAHLKQQYADALGLDVDDLSEEIAILRQRALDVVKASVDSPHMMPLLTKVLREIVRAVATQQALRPSQMDVLSEATTSVIDELRAASARAAITDA